MNNNSDGESLFCLFSKQTETESAMTTTTTRWTKKKMIKESDD
jgi:hypothetical protein